MGVAFVDNHSHEIGDSNIKFHRISEMVKEEIKRKFMDGLCFNAVREWADNFCAEGRDSLITNRDIRAVQLFIEKMKYALHEKDSNSVQFWVDELKKTGELLYCVQEGNGRFELAICPQFGQECLKRWRKLICLDSTHKTTSYNFNLFTLLTQNEHGQGFPVAFLISSDGKTATLERYLQAFKFICPSVLCFMTDNDDAEISAIRNVFPESFNLLCWWHVIKAQKIKLLQGSSKTTDPEAFENRLMHLLKSSEDFESDFAAVCKEATPEFKDYLDVHWFGKRKMWAFSFRKDIPMYRRTNTNMMIESFHNILKTQFFSGKINRRVDRLVYMLTGPIQNHFKRKDRENKFEINGPCPRKTILHREVEYSYKIKSEDFVKLVDDLFEIESKSDPGKMHAVDVLSRTCN